MTTVGRRDVSDNGGKPRLSMGAGATHPARRASELRKWFPIKWFVGEGGSLTPRLAASEELEKGRGG